MPLARALTLGAILLVVPVRATEPTTYIWTGAAKTGSDGSYQAEIANAANWQGGVAPGSSSSNFLVIGPAAGIGTYDWLDLKVPSANPVFEVAGFSFLAGRPGIYLHSLGNLTLGLGADGLSLAGETDDLLSVSSDITLRLDQVSTPWATEGTLTLYGPITEKVSSAKIVKTGSGELVLHDGSSNFSGGLELLAGTLTLSASSTASGSTVTSGPVGTGTLKLAGGTALKTSSSGDVTLHNPVALGDLVTLGTPWHEVDLTLAGRITPLQSTTTIRLADESTVFLTGALGTSDSGSNHFTFTDDDYGSPTLQDGNGNAFPVAVLSGQNTHTGNLTAYGVGVIFLANQAIPGAGTVGASSGGYIGVGESGGMESVLAKIASRTAFNGTLGFDTDPDLSSVPTTFADTVDLTDFTADNDSVNPQRFWGLGSLTTAKLTGAITPPTGGNYVFGGGDGTLYVVSNLTAATGVRVRSSSSDEPLTVWLQGTNTFTDKLLSDHSIVVLDSASALPATVGGNTSKGFFQLDSNAYVGYTEATGWTPAEFVARFVPTSDHSTSILGFDSAHQSASYTAFTGRTIADAIDLSSLTDIFIGTSTHVHLTSDSIKAPGAQKRLSLTGVDGGWLTIDGQLQTGQVTSLLIGHDANDTLAHGIVELTNAASNYTGGTTLQAGYLVLGASSTTVSNTVTSGPLGTGPLTIDGVSYQNTPVIAASSSGLTLNNPVALHYSGVRFGIYPGTNDDKPDHALDAYKTHGLALAGAISGDYSVVSFAGPATFTLSADNSGLTHSQWNIGAGNALSQTLVIAAHDQALGAASSDVFLAPGADLRFTTSAPVVGSLSGGDISSHDTNNHSYIQLADASALTIQQNENGALYASFIGTGAFDLSAAATAPSSSAGLVKTGSGALKLYGTNALTGGLTIQQGTVHFGTQGSLAVGTITLNGGSLSLAEDVILSNALSFGANGGTIGGNGTYASALAIGANVTLAPGESPGTTTFTNGLTFASDGTYVFQVQSGPGGAYLTDLAAINGTLAITATAGDPFVLRLESLNASGAAGALASWDNSLNHSWTLASATAIAGYAPEKFTLDVSTFASPLGGGSFALLQSGNNLVLNFTPVPEPSTYALLALGLGFVAWQVRRRSRG